MSREWGKLNPANAVTASRFLTLPPFLYFLDQGDYQLATLMIIYCGLADMVDGAVARAFKCTSAFGEMFDAIADGICYAFYLGCVIAYGRVPLTPILVVLGLGGINAIMRLVYVKRAGRVTNYRSYAMERLVGFVAYLAGFGTFGYQVEYFAWSCAGCMVVVMLHDTKRMLIDPVDPEVPH